MIHVQTSTHRVIVFCLLMCDGWLGTQFVHVNESTLAQRKPTLPPFPIPHFTNRVADDVQIEYKGSSALANQNVTQSESHMV